MMEAETAADMRLKTDGDKKDVRKQPDGRGDVPDFCGTESPQRT